MMKFFYRAAVSLLLFSSFIFPLTVQAQGQFSLLPQATKGTDCTAKMNEFEKAADQAAFIKGNRNDVLGCGIQTGRISLGMIPFYITYLTNFLLGMSGIICVLFIVIGGYHYVIGGIIEEKEKGKNTIKHALMGMGLALLAWTIVTVLINAVTG